MVKASNEAETQFTNSPSVATANTASVSPKPAASPGVTRPCGIGLPAVRVMRASMSASYHILSAPAAPAPTAMQSSAVSAITGCTWPGAINSPTSAVNTTSDITRGLSNAT